MKIMKIKDWFKKTFKEKEDKNRDFVKTLETKELKKVIKDQEEFLKEANYEYYKRKDKSLIDKIGDTLYNIILDGIIIIFLGIIMFGGLPSLFGVNNEFTNPTNFINIDIMGNATNSVEMIGNINSYLLTTLMDIGKNSPKLWFWLFWVGVFFFVIYPISKIIYFIIKKLIKKE